MGVLGLAVLVGLIVALTESGRDAARKAAGVYRSRRDAWLARHPGSVAPARFAGALATAIHGWRPAWRAFRRDWRHHYRHARDRVRERYGVPVDPQPATATATDPGAPWRDPTPEPEAAPVRPAPAGTGPTPARPDDREPLPVWPPEPGPSRPTFTVIPGGAGAPHTPGGTVPITEISSIDDLRRAQQDVVDRTRAELDDALAARARAEGHQAEAQHLADAARMVLDRDPAAVLPVAAQVDPATQRVSAAGARVLAAEQQHTLAVQALAALERHRPMEEAAAATPGASTNTDVYRPN